MTTLRTPLESLKQSHLGLYRAELHRDTSKTLETLHKRDEQLHQRNGELHILHALTAAVNASHDLSTIPGLLKKLMLESLSIPGGAIFLFDEAREIPSAHWGISEAHFITVQAAAIELAHCYPLHTVPALSHNGTSLRLINPKSTYPEWASGLCVQVAVGGSIRGMLYLFSHAPLIASTDQASFYETLGQNISIVIEKAQLDQQAHTQQKQIQQLSRRLVEVQETERRSIAHELHDEIGQSLTGLKLLLELADCFAPDGGNIDLNNAIEVVHDLIGQVRNLSLDLRPSILDDLGLQPALAWQFRRYTNTTRIHVHFEHSNLARRFAPEIETAAYRIVQEALTNVARYAGVKEVDVFVGYDDEQLLIKVKDQGIGFDAQGVLSANLSTGVAGMMERAALLHGTLEIKSASGAGTCITARLPLSQKAISEGS